MNAYFKLMNDARKSGDPSFVYKGTTYYRSTAKTGLTVYKKSGGSVKPKKTKKKQGKSKGKSKGKK